MSGAEVTTIIITLLNVIASVLSVYFTHGHVQDAQSAADEAAYHADRAEKAAEK